TERSVDRKSLFVWLSADSNRHPFRCSRFYSRRRFRAVPRDMGLMFRTPVAKHAHERAQSLTIFSQRIFHPKRHFVENLSSDDTVAFQLAQMLGQHLSRNSRNGPLQFEKTTNAAFTEMPKDERFPFSANHRQSYFHRAVVSVAISHFHVTALQNSAFLLALSNALISDAEVNLQAKRQWRRGEETQIQYHDVARRLRPGTQPKRRQSAW